ncbi:hypothetical protein HPB49_024695 [Dermacentor silvarum]|uniref:Uncharacterized protein n=1 Tax=Dermacentor silvarum TaxID=543639 RepID=A0ACB8DLE6_DERSI|nr:hypothetical protein HPB49_024695 [Dermacentor silvarum]
MEAIPVAFGSNNAEMYSRAKFRFPAEEAIPVAFGSNKAEMDNRAKFRFLAEERASHVHLQCLSFFNGTMNERRETDLIVSGTNLSSSDDAGLSCIVTRTSGGDITVADCASQTSKPRRPQEQLATTSAKPASDTRLQEKLATSSAGRAARFHPARRPDHQFRNASR